MCNVGGGVDRRHNSLQDCVETWLARVCNLPWVDHEQVVPEWDRWVQKKDERTGAPEFRTVHTADGPRLDTVMELQQAKLDVAYTDDEGTRGYVDVAYTNACTDDARATERNARTPGRAASEREKHKRKRYPPEQNPHVELTPFVVEARGRLGSEVLAFLKQHAPAEESLRSVVLATALREISIVTQTGLARLLLSAEPRPVCV